MREISLLIAPGVENLGMISFRLYRSGQPSKDGFEVIKKMGIKRVINLREEDKESSVLKKLDIESIHFPLNSDKTPDIKDIIKVLKLFEDDVITLIHCLHGMDRTGLICFCHRVMRMNWNFEEAYEEMQRYIVDGTVYKPITEAAKKFWSLKRLGRIK